MKRSHLNGFVQVQRGSTLVIGLVMLLLTSVSLVTVYNITQTSMNVVQNLQSQNNAIDLANSTLEAAISNTRVVNAPNAVFLVGCQDSLNTRCYDIDGDGSDDVTVELEPEPFCVQSQIIQNNQLNLADPIDASCVISTRTDYGVVGSANTNSLCANSLWEVTARASDIVTNTNQTVRGNYGIRVSTDAVDTSCPAS